VIATISLLDFFRGHYAPLRLATAVHATRSRYESDIGRLKSYLGREPKISDLTPETIVGLCARMLADGRSPATCNKIRSELLAMATFAAKRGIATWPDGVPKQREFQRAPTAWDAAQLNRLFAAASESPGMIGDIPAHDWWPALFAVLWDTGARIGAVMQMRWAAVDLERRTVILLAETQKHRADQLFRLHPQTMTLISALRESDPLFAWPYSTPFLWKNLRRLLKRAGLPHTRRDMFHRMRRSVASHYEAHGGDATVLLGHSSRAVTMAYLDPTITGGKHPADVLFRP
jgi:integrase